MRLARNAWSGFCLIMLIFSQASASCLISEEIKLSFAPRESYLFIKSDESVLIERASLLPTTAGTWGIGALIDGTGVVEASFLVLGESDQAFGTEPKEFILNSKEFRCLSEETLHSRLVEEQKRLEEVRQSAANTNKILRRIQSDVDLVVDLGEIVSVKERRLELEEQVAALKRDLEVLKQVFQVVRNQPNPRNFLRREAELTRQIPLLAEGAQLAERGEGARAQQLEGGLQRRLKAIKEAEGLSKDELFKKLVGLRKYRAELEGGRESQKLSEQN